MSHNALIERFFETLISGDRPSARTLVAETLDQGATPQTLITDLFWPTNELIDRLFRADQLTILSHHLATRLLRVLVDQAAARFEACSEPSRSVFAVCGQDQENELAAQMAVDLIEASGMSVTFAGGGIPADEILQQVHSHRPDVLLMFASSPTDLPHIRRLVDTLGEIGAHRAVQIVVGGGVFNRADGLAEEIGADLWASDPLELVEMITGEPERRADADQRTVGRRHRTNAA